MSIIAFYELDSGQRRGKVNNELQREYDRTYMAISNSPRDRELEILLSPKCPKPRVTLSDWDGVARCTDVDFDYRSKSRWRWVVKAHFSTVQTEPEKRDNPLDDDAEVEVKTQIVMKERLTDRQGRPYTNRAGDLIKVMRPVPQVTISITKNVNIYGGWIRKIGGVINNAPVRIDGELYEAYSLTVTGTSIGKTQWRNDKPYKVCQVELAYDEEGWIQPVLNQGFNELIPDPSGKKKKNGKVVMVKQRCLNDRGEPEANPVFLDEKGARPRELYEENGIIKSRPKQILQPEDIVILKLDQMDLFDFNKLPLK